MREIKTYEHFFVNYLYKLDCNIFLMLVAIIKCLKLLNYLGDVLKVIRRFDKIFFLGF